MEQGGLAPIYRWSIIGLLLLLIYMGLFAKRGWFDWRRLVSQNAQLYSRIELEKNKLDELEKRTQSLRTDKKEQERWVRDVLGYVRPNETVVEFE